MAAPTKGKDKSFNVHAWRRQGLGAASADDSVAPPNPEATLLSATASGNSPRWMANDGSHAIWTAVAEFEVPVHDENADGGVRVDRVERAITLQGDLGRVNPGEMLSCKGRWKNHPKHGWSFHVVEYRSALPTSAAGISTWLKTKVDGIGPTFADAIVAHFGHQHVFDLLDEDPERLREVRTAKGRALPEKQVEKAIAAWDDVKAIRQIETFLFSYGVTASLAGKLYRKYGPEVVNILQKNPYRITEIKSVGFRIADKVAIGMGTPLNDPLRIMAAILFVLDEAESQGHTFLSLQQLVGHTTDALKPPGAGRDDPPPPEVRDPQRIVECAGKLSGYGRIVVEEDSVMQQRIYSKRMHRMECQLARNIRHLLETPTQPLYSKPERPTAPDGTPQEQIDKMGLPTDAQWSAVEMIRLHRLAMLTGGPGVGKTHTTRTIVDIATRHAGLEVKLCAPTGKAARRMQELTGHPAATIHRMLEFSPFDGGFQRDESNPIEADLIVVDETSMLSLDLAVSFFRAIGEHTHVLMVGDPDQLAPVGAGKVLDDLIKSEIVPRVHLGRIFRQAAASMIIQNARRINRGKVPYMRKEEAEAELQQPMLSDFFWITRKSAEETAAETLDIACNRLPRAYNLDPVKDIMVLAPMRDGKVGLHHLNAEMEKRLNVGPDGRPKKPIIQRKLASGVFETIAVGSRIVQTKNDYTPQREVMNGELAVVLDYDEAEKQLLLSLDDGEREIWVPAADCDTYHPAWALTTHKSQGSEFKCVVVPVSTAHFRMLNRALFYTAVTRAKKLCVMVGERKALSIAVGNPDMKKRNSTLTSRVLDATLSGELF